ncbi:MAG: VOC family protein [Actinomycetes bacterium]
MPAAAFKDLCYDAADPATVARFWAAATGREWEQRDGVAVVRGGPLHAIWFSPVPEPKVDKNRVHLDLHVPDVGALVAVGATVLAEHDGWSVLADPEGNELCAFPGDAGGAAARPLAVCVDSDRPVELASWWQWAFGGEVGPGPDGRPRWLHGAGGLGEVVLKAVPVDDPRTVKNRCHWDVVSGDVDALVGAGATVLRTPDDEVPWTVLADPQGNEFCAFAPA